MYSYLWIIMTLFIVIICLFVDFELISQKTLLNRAIYAICLAAYLCVSVLCITNFIFLKCVYKSTVTITALNNNNSEAEGSEVWLKGVRVDGRWVDASNIDIRKGKWIKNGNMLGWRNYDVSDDITDSLNLLIPGANKNTVLVFESNRWRGVVEIQDSNKKQSIDLYSKSNDGNKEISIHPRIIKNRIISKIAGGIAAIIFVMCFALCLKKPNKVSVCSYRNIELDSIKAICTLCVVLLHYTCGDYYNYPELNERKWIYSLLINSFTSFAVPVFFMISGALMINNKKNNKRIVLYNTPILYLSLLFWTAIYVIYTNIDQGHLNASAIAKSIFNGLYESQYFHLWFMYPLIGLYLATPIITKLYYSCSDDLKVYIGILFLILPVIIYTLSTVYSGNGIRLWFYWGFPELAPFILGKYVKDKVDTEWEKLSCKKIILKICLCLYIIVLLSYISTRENGQAKNTYFSYGLLPALFYAIYMFEFIYLVIRKNEEKLLLCSRQVIVLLSGMGMGIYFCHLLVRNICIENEIVIKANYASENIINAILCYILSFAICYIFSHYPYFGGGFGKVQILKRVVKNDGRK